MNWVKVLYPEKRTVCIKGARKDTPPGSREACHGSSELHPFLSIVRQCVALILVSIAVASVTWAEENVFDTMCLTESALIALYKAAITNPNATIDWDQHLADGLEKDSFQTKDGKTIRGLVWRTAEPKGYLLIAQGTSMLAAEIYENFKFFRELGLDVYLYDYRGYGQSGHITTTLEGMVSDYSIRLNELNALPEYKEHYILGLSVGGVIFANAIKGMHEQIHGVIFDSVPHVVPWYAFCPSDIDPIRLLPASCSSWLFIGGADDNVIGERASKLATHAKEHCGGDTKIEEHFGHIFMDGYQNTIERASAARGHLKRLVAGRSNGD